MSEASLTIIMNSVIDAAFSNFKSMTARKKFYKEVIEAFQDAGWHTEQECLGGDPSYDGALKDVFEKQGRDVDVFEEHE